MTTPHGATPDEWDHFSLVLGLTADLLPVVSNPDAQISPQSKMKSLGKTPSIYNRSGHVAGIANWTQRVSTNGDIVNWREQPDYGICLQTRSVRALDCDIANNPVLAKDIHDEIDTFLQIALPARQRADSSKFLLAFTLRGDYSKRTITTEGGIIEFLATGQQFIAAGRHQDGARYEWVGGSPDDIPELLPDVFEKLWTRLIKCFAVEGSNTTSVPSTKPAKLTEAIQNDPVAQHLIAQNVVLSTERDGRLHIVCPFQSEHTNDSAESATSYFPARTGGYERGHFHCLHAHCGQRTDAEFLAALGIDTASADFDILPGASETKESAAPSTNRYKFEPWETSIDQPPPKWWVKGVIPQAALGVIFGPPGSGKTFLALDIGCAVARGEPWRGIRVNPGRVAYIAAEDAAGVRHRLKAYALHNNVLPGSMPLAILADSPSFMKNEDVAEVLKALKAWGAVDLIFVDTWSRVIAGFDENSAEHVTKAIKYCEALHRHTGAIVILIHHSGKDSTKGARGSTALLGAADCEIEITRSDDDRVAQITKLKNSMDGMEFGFKLAPVEVARDEDGEPIMSCVVEHTQAKKKAKSRKPGDVGEIILRLLNEHSLGGPLAEAELIELAVNQMVLTPGAKRDQRGANAGKALLRLIADSRVTRDSNGKIGLPCED